MSIAKLKETYVMLTYEVTVTWPRATVPSPDNIASIGQALQSFADKELFNSFKTETSK